MVTISEVALSILLLMPLSDSHEAIQQHSKVVKTEKYIHKDLVEIGNTYKKDLEEKKRKEKEAIENQLKIKQKKEAESTKQKNNTKKKHKENSSRGERVESEMTFTLTFYTDLPSENGGYSGTCESKKLVRGMVASNHYKLGTKIKLDKYGTVTVKDTGGVAFNRSNRLDVFIPRNRGEDDTQYLKRVNNMGKVNVKGCIVK